MGSIKLFDSLFGAESFPRNVRRGRRAEGASRPRTTGACRSSRSAGRSRIPAISTALVGCRTVAEVEDNAGAVGWSISDEDLAEIDAIFEPARRRDRPGLLDRGRLTGRGASPWATSSPARSRSSPAAPAASAAAIVERFVAEGARGRHRRRRRRAGRSAGRRARRRGRVPADRRRRRRRRSRRSSTSRSRASAGSTSCATTPAIAGRDPPLPRRRPAPTSTRVMARQPLRRDARQPARGAPHGRARRRLDHQHHVDRRDQRRRAG